MKKILFVLFIIVAIYVILWIFIYLGCLSEYLGVLDLPKIGPFLFEPCISSLFPLPQCVCF